MDLKVFVFQALRSSYPWKYRRKTNKAYLNYLETYGAGGGNAWIPLNRFLNENLYFQRWIGPFK